MSQICERPGLARNSSAAVHIGTTRLLTELAIRIFETPIVWMERWEHRQKLRQLDDSILRDIGLSRADIYREARKPFWRA
ncbi:MAG: DUF1127 domain-containing protein [Pseudomonadota bacterium]